MRRWTTASLTTVLALVAALGVGAAPAHAVGERSMELLVAARAAFGSPGIVRAPDLDQVAQGWANELARSGSLRHNENLGAQVGNWALLAENVGYGTSDDAVHLAFVNSADHRANMLDSRFSEVGIGAALGGGQVWVVQVFRQPLVAVVPAPAPVPVAAPAPVMTADAARAFVREVYSDLLGRQPDAAGQQQWVSRLTSGTSSRAVAAEVTASVEYRSRVVQQAYQRLLGRSPDAGSRAAWVGALGAGQTQQGVEAQLVASAEFAARAGAGDAAWVRRAYATVLGRQPSQAELGSWVAVLAGGTSRYAVAAGFLMSTEDLAGLLDGWYLRMLDRHLDAAGRANWVGAIQSGRARVESVLGDVVASPEYAAHR